MRAALKPALALTSASRATIRQAFAVVAVLLGVGGFLALLANGPDAGSSALPFVGPALWGALYLFSSRNKRRS